MDLPDDVLHHLRRAFDPEQQGRALAILAGARLEDGSAPSHRLIRCAVVASQGSLAELRRLAGLLAIDWRDVVLAGEYALRGHVPVQVRDLSEPLQS